MTRRGRALDDLDIVLYIAEHVCRVAASTIKKAREERLALLAAHEADSPSSHERKAA